MLVIYIELAKKNILFVTLDDNKLNDKSPRIVSSPPQKQLSNLWQF